MKIAIRIAIMAITTSSSIGGNAGRFANCSLLCRILMLHAISAMTSDRQSIRLPLLKPTRPSPCP